MSAHSDSSSNPVTNGEAEGWMMPTQAVGGFSGEEP